MGSQANTGKLTKHRPETYLAGKLKLMTLLSLKVFPGMYPG